MSLIKIKLKISAIPKDMVRSTYIIFDDNDVLIATIPFEMLYGIVIDKNIIILENGCILKENEDTLEFYKNFPRQRFSIKKKHIKEVRDAILEECLWLEERL